MGNPGTPEGRAKGGKRSLATHRREATAFKLLRKVKAPRRSAMLAELLGIVAGDGHVDEYQATITTHAISDLIHAQYAAGLFRKLFGIEPTFIFRKDSKAVVVLVSSKEVCRLLVQHGAIRGNKIHNGLRMPNWVKQSDAYRRAFVRGLFDTDGSVYLDRHRIRDREYENIAMIFTSRAPRLLADFKASLIAFDFRPTQKTEYAVFLRRAAEISAYFQIVGSSNPKHAQKVREYFARRRRGVRVVE